MSKAARRAQVGSGDCILPAWTCANEGTSSGRAIPQQAEPSPRPPWQGQDMTLPHAQAHSPHPSHNPDWTVCRATWAEEATSAAFPPFYLRGGFQGAETHNCHRCESQKHQLLACLSLVQRQITSRWQEYYSSLCPPGRASKLLFRGRRGKRRGVGKPALHQWLCAGQAQQPRDAASSGLLSPPQTQARCPHRKPRSVTSPHEPRRQPASSAAPGALRPSCQVWCGRVGLPEPRRRQRSHSLGMPVRNLHSHTVIPHGDRDGVILKITIFGPGLQLGQSARRRCAGPGSTPAATAPR